MVILTKKDNRYLVGGKAENLFLLQANGFVVPPFVVVPAEEYKSLVSGKVDPAEAAKEYKFPPALFSKLESELPPAPFYAVRSSAMAEDGSERSYAGLFSTFLYVPSQEVPARIKDVWLSACDPRVVAYRQELTSKDEMAVAVIVQCMVGADVSGVAFGVNPVSGDEDEVVINAVYGLGEGLVSGELNADTYYVKKNKLTRSDLVSKEKKLVFDERQGKGSSYVSVDPAIRLAPCLSQAQCREIAQVLGKLKGITGRPQDVEFVYQDGKLYILQTRPVTTLRKNQGDEFVIWDNSNIIESYPGLTSPLTFSFILPVYEAVYRQMALLMGVHKTEVEKNSPVFANMLGLLYGKVYYNLLNWYKALALLPGFSLNSALMEKMMGVKERFELKDLPKRNKVKERLRVGWMIVVLLKNLRRLPSMKKSFVRDFNKKVDEFEKIDLSERSGEELMLLFRDFEQTLLKKWKAPLVNDFFAMIYFGVLQKLTVKYQVGEAATLHNGLLSGAGDIISTEPIHRCIELAELIASDKKVKDEFLSRDARELLALLDENKLPPSITTKIRQYLDRFGNRCVGELKLETITYRQDPSGFLKVLKSYVEQGVTSEKFNSTSPDLRKKSEAQVKIAFKNRPLSRVIFRHVLKQARIMVSDRENLRYERTRAFGKVRDIFIALGKKLASSGAIPEPRDIFYLTKEEIFAFIKGTSVTIDLPALIVLRKNEYKRFEGMSLDERIKTRGPVYLNELAAPKPVAAMRELKGLGCCPGIVRAKVRVVFSPDEIENLGGDILVTSSTDPGWVTLFPTASGILVERGSLLSHSAIVSREMGKPCIVGITGLLQTLKTGDEVEMNGMTGEVKQLTQNTSNAAADHAKSEL